MVLYGTRDDVIDQVNVHIVLKLSIKKITSTL